MHIKGFFTPRSKDVVKDQRTTSYVRQYDVRDALWSLPRAGSCYCTFYQWKTYFCIKIWFKTNINAWTFASHICFDQQSWWQFLEAKDNFYLINYTFFVNIHLPNLVSIHGHFLVIHSLQIPLDFNPFLSFKKQLFWFLRKQKIDLHSKSFVFWT